MTPAEPEYLLNVVDEETYYKICEAMQGLRIYFPTSKQKVNAQISLITALSEESEQDKKYF